MAESKRKLGITIGIVVFIGCLLIGGSIGNMSDTLDVGATGGIGMGVGFISMAAIWAYYWNK